MRLARALSTVCGVLFVLASAGDAQEGGSGLILAQLREEDARTAVTTRRAVLAALVQELDQPGQSEPSRHRLRAGIDQVARELVELTGEAPGEPWEPARQEALEARDVAAQVGPPPPSLREQLGRFAEYVRQRLAVMDAEERASRRAKLEAMTPAYRHVGGARFAVEDELWEARLELGRARQELERARVALERARAGVPSAPEAPPAQAPPVAAPAPPRSQGILGILER